MGEDGFFNIGKTLLNLPTSSRPHSKAVGTSVGAGS
jgi:hypothetical protein